MNLNTTSVVVFIVGVLLVYSAVTNVDPRDVVLKALGKTARYPLLDGPKKYGKRLRKAQPTGSDANAQWVGV